MGRWCVYNVVVIACVSIATFAIFRLGVDVGVAGIFVRLVIPGYMDFDIYPRNTRGASYVV